MESHVDPSLGPVLTALARSAVATSFAPRPPTAAEILVDTPAALAKEAGSEGPPAKAALSEGPQAKAAQSTGALVKGALLKGALSKREATFVTLERDGVLRGCIGTLSALRPLGFDVVRNARLAARDPRLPPVRATEVDALRITVTVLSPAEPVAVAAFAALLALLRPGQDGLVLKDGGGRRATFLPSVWASLPEPERFVAALLRKGRWPESLWSSELHTAAWPEDLAAERYAACTFRE